MPVTDTRPVSIGIMPGSATSRSPAGMDAFRKVCPPAAVVQQHQAVGCYLLRWLQCVVRPHRLTSSRSNQYASRSCRSRRRLRHLTPVMPLCSTLCFPSSLISQPDRSHLRRSTTPYFPSLRFFDNPIQPTCPTNFWSQRSAYSPTLSEHGARRLREST